MYIHDCVYVQCSQSPPPVRSLSGSMATPTGHKEQDENAEAQLTELQHPTQHEAGGPVRRSGRSLDKERHDGHQHAQLDILYDQNASHAGRGAV